MEDFGFKLQDIKEKYGFKRIIKIALLIISIIALIVIARKIVKTFSEDNSKVENVTLIKKEAEEMKKLPAKEGGLIIENLDVNVYDVIDNNTKGDSNPIIKNTKQDIDVKTTDPEENALTEQELLAAKINALTDDDFSIEVEPEEKQPVLTSTKNIKINNEEKKPTTDVNDLKKLGNDALIKNLKNNKDSKPGIKVQLLALKSRDGLVDYWNEVKSKYNSLFRDKTYYIEKVSLNRVGTIYRLQVGTFDNSQSATEFCQEYIKLTNKNKVDCIIVKN